MNKLIKIFEELPMENRAALAFTAQAEGNQKLSNEIMHSIPYANYKQRHAKFVDRIQALERVALIWGLEYWRLSAICVAHSSQAANALKNSNIEKFEYFRESEIHLNIGLAALELVLDSLDQEYGIKKQTILELTGAVECGQVDADEGEYSPEVLDKRDEYLYLFRSNISN